MSVRSVAFLTLDWSKLDPPLIPNGCAWYRCVLPAHELKKRGWFVGVGLPAWTKEDTLGLLMEPTKAVAGWDVIVLKLVMLQAVADSMAVARANGQKIVVDIDDFHEGLSASNHAYKATDPATNPLSNREHYFRIIDQADALITATPFLRDYYQAQGKRVFLVRNGIDLDRWKPRKDHAGRMPTIGWVGATPWRSNDLEQMRPFLNDFMSQHHLEFHHAGHINGAPRAADQMGLNVKTTREPMRLIHDYPRMFRNIDIGIVPLSDVPFNHAKSAIKGLEYAAAGIPFIASPSPEYIHLESLGIGRVARTPTEWESALTTFLDPKVRALEVERNLDGVRNVCSIDRTGREWSHALQMICST